MEKASQDVLVVGAGVPSLERVVPLLERTAIRVRHTGSGADALELIRDVAFALVIVRHPLAGARLAELIGAMRAPDSPCHAAGLLLLADEAAAPEVGGFLGRGVNRIVSLSAPSATLLNAVAELLSVAPRRALRRPVRLSLWCEGGAGPQPGETVDISSKGMLVRCEARPEVGSGVTFELGLPDRDEVVRGEGEVVRHAEWPRERERGFAVRFVSFSSESWQRLVALIDEW